MNRIISRAMSICGCAIALTAVPAFSQQVHRGDDASSAAVEHPTGVLVIPVTAVDVEREIALGETRVGTLTAEDPQLEDGEYYHAWVFNGRADDRIVVSLHSTAFDGYLAIFTADGEWEEQDDDSGGESDARLDVTLPATGRYAIVVTSYAGGEMGEYSLSVRAHESDGSIARGSAR